MTAPVRWHADVFTEAVWASSLSPRAKLMALAYVRHVRDARGDRTAAADLAWMTYDRAMEQTSIGKRATVTTVLTELVDAGWFVPVRVIARRPTLYRLTIPTAAVEGTTDTRTATTGTAPAPVEAPAPGTTAPPVVPAGEPPAPAGSSLPGPGSSLSETDSSHGGTTVVPTGERNISLKTSQHHQRGGTVAYVADRLGVDDDDATKVIEKIKTSARGGAPRALGAYVRSISTADLAEHLDAVRAATPPAPAPPTATVQDLPTWKADLAARAAAPRRGPGASLARRVLAGEIRHTDLPGPDLADVIALRPTQTA